MNNEIEALLKTHKVQGTPAPATGKTTHGKTQLTSFEALLGQVTKALDNLKNETSEHGKRLAPEVIGRPEELLKALAEAGQKYHSCLQAGRHLANAYEATMNAVDKGKAPIVNDNGRL